MSVHKNENRFFKKWFFIDFMGFTMSKNVLISSRLSLLHLILGYLDNLDFLSYLKNLKQRSESQYLSYSNNLSF